MPDPSAHEKYLATATDRYREAHAGLRTTVERAFPDAAPVFEWEMPAWKIPRPAGAPMPQKAGTIDPTQIFVGLVERKAGLTLHLWYPGDYDLFERHAPALTAAGFKIMRGCLVFNRKQPFPIAAIATLLEGIRKSEATAGDGVKRAAKKATKRAAAKPKRETAKPKRASAKRTKPARTRARK